MDLMQLIDLFVKDVLYSLLEEESGASSELMVAAASLIHEHTEMQRHMHIYRTTLHRENAT
jgi:hypothetical protein